MTKPDLRARRQEATRNDILNAAEEVMARHGFDQLTMRDLAAEAGCSPATIYLYFNDKHALILELFNRNFDEHIRLIEERWSVDADPLEQLKSVFDSMNEVVDVKQGVFVQFMKHLPINAEGPVSYLVGESRRRFIEFEERMTALLRVCQERGQIRSDIPAELLRELFVRFMEMIHEILSRRGTKPLTANEHGIAWSILESGFKMSSDAGRGTARGKGRKS